MDPVILLRVVQDVICHWPMSTWRHGRLPSLRLCRQEARKIERGELFHQLLVSTLSFIWLGNQMKKSGIEGGK